MGLGGLIVRLGLGGLAPFVLPALAGLLLGGGGVLAWWFDWFNLIETTILVAGAVFIYLYSVTSSQIMRLVIVAALVGLGYLKGRIDENAVTESRIHTEVTKIHTAYKRAADDETSRQEKINAEAAQKAAVERAFILKQLTESRGELQKVREEASRDKNSERPALSVDSIDRLNGVRSNQSKRGRARRPET